MTVNEVYPVLPYVPDFTSEAVKNRLSNVLKAVITPHLHASITHHEDFHCAEFGLDRPEWFHPNPRDLASIFF
jgi:hypothetical protein